IVLAATWAREAFILPGMLAPGTHVTTLGADEPGKAEVSAEVIRAALFVCDDRALAVEMGALGGVGLGPEAVGAELGEVLGGAHPGRTSSEQLTVYGVRRRRARIPGRGRSVGGLRGGPSQRSGTRGRLPRVIASRRPVRRDQHPASRCVPRLRIPA